MKYSLPTLYQKDQLGKIRYWKIFWKVKKRNTNNSDGFLWTEHGILNGKQTTSTPRKIPYKIKITTEQMNKKLRKLAETKWKNKLKVGFVEKQSQLNTNKKIPSIINPMRTHDFTKMNHRIQYPAYVQVKYDGYRALTNADKLIMMSRQGNPLQNVTHITKELKTLLKEAKTNGIYLDGELFLPEGIHQLKSLISKANRKPDDVTGVKYYIFDMIDTNNLNMTFENRWKRLKKLFQNKKLKYIFPAETYLVKNKTQVNKYLDKFLKNNHEGLVIRNKHGIYKLGGKSVDVQKLIKTLRGSFEIIDYKEGAGGVVVWKMRCLKDESRSFWAMPMGTNEYRKGLLKNAKRYVGERVQVKFFEIDKNGCVTRNPVVVMKKA